MSNFADDIRIIEFWEFDNNLIAGKNGNDLTAAAGGVGYDSAFPAGGSSGLDLEDNSNQWAYRNDADLSAGFPLKNGDTVKKGTWCLWFKIEQIKAWYTYLLSKYDTGAATLAIAMINSSYPITIFWGGASYNIPVEIYNGVLYHIGLAFDGIAKTISVRLWDGSTATTYTHTFASALSVYDVPFVVGNKGALSTSFDFDGKVGGLVVANDILSIDEIDLIRQGTFGIPLTGRRTFPVSNYRTVWQSQAGKRKFPLPGEQIT